MQPSQPGQPALPPQGAPTPPPAGEEPGPGAAQPVSPAVPLGRRSPASAESFVELNEQVYEEVARWAADYVEMIIEALSPGGRPFGAVELSDEERAYLYVSKLRGNPASWIEWIENRAQEIIDFLRNSGVDPSVMPSVHPYDIAEAMAVAYSAEMETLLMERDYWPEPRLARAFAGDSAPASRLEDF